MSRRKNFVVGCLAVTVLGWGACYAALHRAWLYKGGAISDSGVVSYPRFHASFSPLPLNRPGKYAFKFRRFPAEEAVVMLNTPSAPRSDALQTLKTKIGMSVTDQEGHVRCEASGFPAGLGAEQAFVTSTPVHAIGIWLSGCNGFSVKNCDACTLIVTLRDIDPRTPDITIVPTLEGGGIELP